MFVVVVGVVMQRKACYSVMDVMIVSIRSVSSRLYLKYPKEIGDAQDA